MKRSIDLLVNRQTYSVLVEPWWTLKDVLREQLGLTGTKTGCEEGDCGACTVIMEGKAVNSCLVLAAEAAGKAVTTIEGLAGPDGLHPLQEAFIEFGAFQCGYCTPGVLMSAWALLDENPNPSREQVRDALAGNLCRCTGYVKIEQAVLAAAARLTPAITGGVSDGRS